MAWDGYNRVYFTTSMAVLVASFQYRHYRDMFLLEGYAGLATALNPCLIEHGLTRLPRLFDCLEDLHAIMLLHGAYSGRVDVVEVAIRVRGVSTAMTMLMIDLAAWNNQRLVLSSSIRIPLGRG
ncbi:hypothetical protein H257_12240 [Aphanomyces astaci]|uniref:Uncharacterized protein n=1 Tax=Aphanomyces astaci TaxID=112090 RepID=W4FZK2_APHAT|nr:hypothetical protein H257_12240 [Aphanomyces astaci]ETV72905.1 hypothetical protein H257_12240 [Aphanomyces astaci]|eukprot:XP_009837691.1 hypothetical protein H257_12240 [Aphanomyces astaci]